MKRRELFAGFVTLVGLSAVAKVQAQPPDPVTIPKIEVPTDVLPVKVIDLLRTIRNGEDGKETPVSVILLKQTGEEQFLPIWIGEAEAVSIMVGLRGEMLARPLAHDVLATLVKALKGQVQSVTIYDAPQGDFYSAAVKVVGNGIEEIVDSRPSDAIALSLRLDSPLYVDRHLLRPINLDQLKEKMKAIK